MLPLLFSPRTNDAFGVIKFTFLAFSAFGLGSLWFFSKLKNRALKFNFNGYLLIFLVFCLSGLIAAPFAFYSNAAVWGRYKAWEGVVAWFSYYIICFLVFQVVRTEEDARKLFVSVLSAAVLSSFYGIGQYFKLDPFRWQTATVRSFASLGNPIILSGFLALVIPLLIIFAAAGRKAVIISLPVLIIALTALLLTFSKSGIYGLFIALAAMGLLYLFRGGSKLRSAAAAGIVLAAAGSAGILIYVTGLGSFFSTRLFNLSSGYFAVRFEMWKIALKIMQRFPFGVGLDNFNLAFFPFSTERFYRLMAAENWAETAHNIFLQIGATAGLTGLAGFLFLLILPLNLFFKHTLRNKESVFYLALAGCGLAYLTFALSGLNNLAIHATLFLLMSSGMAVCLPRREFGFTLKGPVPVLLSYLFIILSVLLMTQAVLFIPAEYNFSRAYYGNEQSMDSREAYGQRAIVLNRFSDLYLSSLAYFYFVRWKMDRSDDAFIKAYEYHEASAGNNPANIFYDLNFGDFLLEAGLSKGGDYLDQAFERFSAAYKISPYSPITLTCMGKIYIARGAPDKAYPYLVKTIDISPKFAEGYYNLALYYLEKDEPEEAAKNFRRAMARDEKYKKDRLVNDIISKY